MFLGVLKPYFGRLSARIESFRDTPAVTPRPQVRSPIYAVAAQQDQQLARQIAKEVRQIRKTAAIRLTGISKSIRSGRSRSPTRTPLFTTVIGSVNLDNRRIRLPRNIVRGSGQGSRHSTVATGTQRSRHFGSARARLRLFGRSVSKTALQTGFIFDKCRHISLCRTNVRHFGV